MKNMKYFMTLLLGVMMVGFVSCKTEDVNDPSKITYEDDFLVTVTGNSVIVKSLVDANASLLWTVNLGDIEMRSTQAVDTFQINGKGDYTVVFGANLGVGGDYVYSDPHTFSIATDNVAPYASELWVKLTGGFGKSKTYMLDVDNNGLSHYNGGPLTFAGTDDSWSTFTLAEAAADYDGNGAIDSWSWGPKYADATWMFGLPGASTDNPQPNFGTMTFSLEGGIPKVTVEHLTITARGVEKGYFEIDEATRKLKIYDATPLHDTNRDAVVVDWGELRIMKADGTGLSLAALRDPALSGEGACLLVYNYCEKTYYDSNVPQPLVFDPENDGAPTLVVPANTGLIGTWEIDVETPFNWAYTRVVDAHVAGENMNVWTSLADYLATTWTGYTQAIHDSISTNNTYITFGADGTFSVKYGVAATASTGTYSLDGTGTIIQFTNITPKFNIGTQTITTSPVSAASAANQLRITQLEATSLWLGQRNTTPGKNEYSVVHFKKQ